MKLNSKSILASVAALAFLAPIQAQTAADDAAAKLAAKAEAPAAAENTNTNNTPLAVVVTDKNRPIRMNFREAPLDRVLDYMSEAGGFIINIVPGTTITGKSVNAWSNSPLTRDEAVQLLTKVLNQNGLAAIASGRTLTIVDKTAAKKYADTKVKSGQDPKEIPKDDEVVTQIIPVHHANATALIQNLQPLLPEYAQDALTANESGNALILTATQTDIHRMVEIVSALDTAISSVSSIKVFPLKYADAKELVNAVKELFTPPQQQQQAQAGGRGNGQFFQQMFGGGGPGGFGGGGPGGFGGGGGPGGFGNRGGGAGGRGGAGNNSQTAGRVVAVADERSNSLIVAAPDEAIPTITELVEKVDVPVDDITELRVFPLKNSDPQEIADMLASLFPDDTTSGSQQQFRFGGGGFGGGRGGFGGFGNRGGQTSTSSDRSKKKSKVIAVPELRTGSLIVSAASEMMPQIEQMIRQIDGNKARQQKVFVVNIENGDPEEIGQVLRDTFDRNGNSRTTTQNQSALAQRQQQAIQQMGQQSQIGQGIGGQGGGAGFGR